MSDPVRTLVADFELAARTSDPNRSPDRRHLFDSARPASWCGTSSRGSPVPRRTVPDVIATISVSTVLSTQTMDPLFVSNYLLGVSQAVRLIGIQDGGRRGVKLKPQFIPVPSHSGSVSKL
jgi:hypothetical protein